MTLRLPVAAVVSAVLAIACGCGTSRRQPPVGERRGAAPPARAVTSDQVFRIGARRPLDGPRARGRRGDWVVRNENLVAVFRARDGRLVDLGFTADRRDVLHRFDSVLSETRGRARIYFPEQRLVTRDAGRVHALELRGRFRDADLDVDVRTEVWAPPGAWHLVLRTTVTNRARLRSLHLGIGDSAYLGNSRLFVPGHGLARKTLHHHAYWIARQMDDRVLALVTGQPAPMRIDLSISEDPFNPTTRTIYHIEDLEHGRAYVAERYLVMHPGTIADASALVHRLIRSKVTAVTLTLPPAAATALGRLGPEVIVTRDGKPVARSPLGRPRTRLTLPSGHTYRARLWLPGAGSGPDVAIDLTPPSPAPPSVELAPPPHGTLAYAVTSATGSPLPARLIFHGVAPTPEPQFGDDGTVDGALNVVYSRTGRGRRVLRPGRYRVLFTRGLEYDVHEARVTVKAGKTTTLNVALARVVDTRGAISADLHLHAAPSPDSHLSLIGRLTQLAAVGVEYAVATDHNAVTDYGPAARAAHLERWVATVVGCEITTRRAEWGHFNIFPLPPGAPVPPYDNQRPHEMFRHWRALSTQPVIQVNHPRMGSIGYFNQVDFDRRHGRAFTRAFAKDFDALELFNGDWVYQPHKVERNLRDWYALLNLGHRFTATGNSDAHKLGFQEAGYPRNFILVGERHGDPAKLGGTVVQDAIRNHRVVVSAGPYISLTRASVPAPAQPGARAADAPGRPRSVVGHQLRAQAGAPTVLRLTVQAACWVPVESVEVIANGKTLHTWKLRTALGRRRPPLRAGQPARCDAVRLTKTLRLAPKRDTWYVVVARSSTPLPVLRKKATAVIGFTNPVWIDADGDGRFEAPGVGKPPPMR